MKNSKGFTIIEILISLGIMTVGMLAVLNLFVQNVQSKSYSKDKLIASMLAQEGIELVRNIRDENWRVNANWTNNIVQDGDYAIDFDSIYSNPSSSISGGLEHPDAQLYVDDKGFYQHNPVSVATSTIFYRLIEATERDLDGKGSVDAIELTSTVRWTRNGHEHDYIISTMIFGWH